MTDGNPRPGEFARRHIQRAARGELSGMRLEQLYRMVFHYPQGWSVALASGGAEGRHLFLAEGRCEGRISGRSQPSPSARGRHLLS
jgi:hypothetical protein